MGRSLDLAVSETRRRRTGRERGTGKRKQKQEPGVMGRSCDMGGKEGKSICTWSSCSSF